MESQNNQNNLNEESLPLSENQTEQSCSQKQTAPTILNSEKNTCKNVSEQQQDTEKKNLKSQKRQSTMTEFAKNTNQSQQAEGTTNKRKNESIELLSAPSKKRTSSTRKPQFNFSTPRTRLFDDRPSSNMDVEEVRKEPAKEPFVFCGESSKTIQKSTQAAQASEENSKSTKQSSNHKPPPIVISTGSAAEIRMLANEINNQPRSFLINLKKDKQGTKTVTTENWKDYHNFVDLLKRKHHHFHTYSTEEPQMKFVVYGLPTMQLEELERGLKAENISPVKIVKMTMKQKRHQDHQNYLLYFKGGDQVGEQANLLKTLSSIEYVDGFKVKFDKYRNKHNGPSQCSNCLQFGHGQRGCSREAICFRCSEKHDSKTCPHKLLENNKVSIEKLKCHFCGEKHTAISQACKTRMQIIENWKTKSANGNNRNQNKPAGHQSQIRTQTGQLRSTQQEQQTFERRNKPAFTPRRQQNRNNEALPSTSQAPVPGQNPVTAKLKPQNTPSLQKSSSSLISAQEKQKPWINKRKKRTQKKNKNKKPMPKSKNQNQKQNRQDPVQDVEAMEISTPSTEEDTSIVQAGSQTTSTDVSAQDASSSKQCDQETPESRCMTLLKELLKIIVQNPECMKFVEQAIGSIATNSTNNHGL